MNISQYGSPGTTNIHTAMLVALILAIILKSLLPRKYVVAPLLLLSPWCPRMETIALDTVKVDEM
jgi:hypothetical protein